MCIEQKCVTKFILVISFFYFDAVLRQLVVVDVDATVFSRTTPIWKGKNAGSLSFLVCIMHGLQELEKGAHVKLVIDVNSAY